MISITNKVYLDDMSRIEVRTKIVKVEANAIYLRDTVAFASDENGIGDVGYIKIFPMLKIPFSNTVKVDGDYVKINGCSKIRVDYDIAHIIDSKYYNQNLVGKKVTIVIDKKNRNFISANYSLMNLIISYLENIRPGIKHLIIKKLIINNEGIIEFSEQLNLTNSEKAYIKRKIKRDIVCGEDIWSFPEENNDGVNLWETENADLLCSGVHVNSCAGIDEKFSIKFKNIDNKLVIYSKTEFRKSPYKLMLFLIIFSTFMFLVATIFFRDIIAILILTLIIVIILMFIMIRLFHKIFSK